VLTGNKLSAGFVAGQLHAAVRANASLRQGEFGRQGRYPSDKAADKEAAKLDALLGARRAAAPADASGSW
jgi:hypothetical protein